MPSPRIKGVDEAKLTGLLKSSAPPKAVGLYIFLMFNVEDKRSALKVKMFPFNPTFVSRTEPSPLNVKNLRIGIGTIVFPPNLVLNAEIVFKGWLSVNEEVPAA